MTAKWKEDIVLRFIDEAVIEITAGNGGAGCISFLRQRFQPKGGPDGGDGGRGGHVILRADGGVSTLADHSYLRYFRAGRGGHGQGSNKTGAYGEDKFISVPVGTVASDLQTGIILADLTESGQEVILAHGGRGGKGNRHFASSTHRAPRLAQPGEEGEKRIVLLTLKLIADIGLIGLPNAGKSTLISALTSARPKIADYPFTTLKPNLGAITLPSGRSVTIADIPGLVAGSHQGQGLGFKFLRHVERTGLFIYVIDISPENPIDALNLLLEELTAYNTALRQRASLVVANKMDLSASQNNLAAFQQQVKTMGLNFIAISAQEKEGLPELLDMLEQQLAYNAD
ncbi:MAG: GTPase ObgE [Desulfarculales bacterium]|jgi:GTP-binding protein|nr:GTPase ObgE [Desulfarculales bacterium]